MKLSQEITDMIVQTESGHQLTRQGTVKLTDGDTMGARSCFKQAIALAPKSFPAHLYLALCEGFMLLDKESDPDKLQHIQAMLNSLIATLSEFDNLKDSMAVLLKRSS